MAVKKAAAPAVVPALKQSETTFRIVGRTPLYFNKMAAKARRSLLVGGSKKTAAERKEIKHDPFEEFRNSVYMAPEGPTALSFPSPAIKGAMATAALETPGVTKSSVNRLIYLPEISVKIWGTPQLKCDVVRSADMNRTPDIRTRAYLPEWCSEVTVRFIEPQLTPMSVLSLLVNAGLVCGIGDFRIEKGKGGYGAFTVDQPGGPLEAEWSRITSEQGRDNQLLALHDPDLADADTDELIQMLHDEIRSREGSAA